MHYYTLDQFRVLTESGGVLGVTLRAVGSSFCIEAETRRGEAVLVPQRSKNPRRFTDPRRALALLRDLGIREAKIDTKNWRPEQVDLDKVSRPDRAEAMRSTYDAADLKRTLEERAKIAADPNTAWIEHDDLFDRLEARYAR